MLGKKSIDYVDFTVSPFPVRVRWTLKFRLQDAISTLCIAHGHGV